MPDAQSFWDRPGLGSAILEALHAAGKDVDALTIDDLALSDQFHGGGKPATVRLARRAGIAPGSNVLDVGGGLGGPARVLAVDFGCSVTAVDLTTSYVEAARMLTSRLGLQERVRHEVADALDLPFAAGAFDVVWTQNSGMNIADKSALYASFRRVLRAGGTLAQQEPMAGPGGPAYLPLMWADEPAENCLLRPDDARQLIEGSGFVTRVWDDITEDNLKPGPALPPHSIQRLVKGDRLDEILETFGRNLRDERIRLVQAVFDTTLVR